MSKEKTISMSELKRVVATHLENKRCSELTRAMLRKEFAKLLNFVEAQAKENS